MNVFTGMTMLILAAAMYVKYKPRAKKSRALCGITGMMGFLSLLAGAGNWKIQLIQLVLQLAVGFCCFVQLRREEKFRRRHMRLHAHRVAGRTHYKVKTCA